MEAGIRGESMQEFEARVSFSELLDSGSVSDEFEFRNPFGSIGEEEDFSGRFPADELFYNGNMLPLEPISRMAMVRDLERRGPGSAPPSPYFDPASRAPSTTRKSSSYPPCGRGSRRFKDFFVGLRKASPAAPQDSNPGKSSASSSVSSSSSSVSSSSGGKFLKNVLNFRKKEGGKALNPGPRHQQQLQQQQVVMIRRNRVASAAAGEFSRSAPATPIHPRAAAGFAPVLHLPLPKFLSHKTIEVL